MKQLIADTNIFMTVVLNLPQREEILEHTVGYDLYAPNILPFEVGNALSAMSKRKQILPNEALQAFDEIQKIPVNLQTVDVRQALQLAIEQCIYAYDGYFLQLAIETELPILTLDKGMQYVAKQLGLPLINQARDKWKH